VHKILLRSPNIIMTSPYIFCPRYCLSYRHVLDIGGLSAWLPLVTRRHLSRATSASTLPPGDAARAAFPAFEHPRQSFTTQRWSSRLSCLSRCLSAGSSQLPKAYADLPGAQSTDNWVQTEADKVNRVPFKEFITLERPTGIQTTKSTTSSSTCAPGAVVTGRWSEIVSDNRFFSACDVSRGELTCRAVSEGGVVRRFTTYVLAPANAAVTADPEMGWDDYHSSAPVATTDSRGMPDFM